MLSRPYKKVGTQIKVLTIQEKYLLELREIYLRFKIRVILSSEIVTV